MYATVKMYLRVETNCDSPFQKTISIIPVKNAADGHKIGTVIKVLYPDYKVTLAEKGEVLEEL